MTTARSWMTVALKVMMKVLVEQWVQEEVEYRQQ